MTTASGVFRRRSLLFRVLAFAFAMVAGVISVIFVLLSWQTNARLTRAVVDGMEASQRRFARIEERRGREQLLQVLALAENPTLKAAIDTYHAERGSGLLIEQLQATIQIEVIKLQQLIDVPGVTQKSAWFLTHRLRAALAEDGARMVGPVEVDETYFGGKRRNMSNTKRKALADTGRGPVGKVAVVGAKDRRTKRVAAKVVRSTDQQTLHGFVEDHAAPGATVYTDDATVYESLRFNHDTVKHSLSEYVKGEIHTNGIESLWSMLKRAHMGTFHKLSPKHLDRYVQEFAGRHNVREQDTIEQMAAVTVGMEGKRLTYDRLIASNGLESGARS